MELGTDSIDARHRYDPAVHLHPTILEEDSLPRVTLLPDFSEHAQSPSFPLGESSRLAYTSDFAILSPAGLAVLNEIIQEHIRDVKETERIPRCLRMLGYKSRFVREFNNCPVVLRFLSRLAGKEMLPHSYTSSFAHVNIGAVGDTRAVDQWHVDSVPFVVVILMSDMKGARGGDLQLIKRGDREAAFELLETTGNRVKEEDMLTVSYGGPGRAIFCQGSLITHHVTPVHEAKNARITLVNSYMPKDPFCADRTVLATFKKEKDTCYAEYAHHKAGRAIAQLAHLRRGWQQDPEANASDLERVAKELIDSAEILRGTRSDAVPFFRENGGNAMGVGESAL
jgi:hypothetical protein